MIKIKLLSFLCFLFIKCLMSVLSVLIALVEVTVLGIKHPVVECANSSLAVRRLLVFLPLLKVNCGILNTAETQ